ncbi:terpene synthase family protein [Streptomyces sp. NPDC058874]|uniref:terpene synthase family protein n=1 Tax=unclassified Streptomyces TaxID=2593676 RepID=UPI0036A8CCF8
MTSLPTPGLRPGDAVEPSSYPSFRLPSLPRFQPALRRPGVDDLEHSCRTWLDDALRDAHADSPQAFEEFLHQRTTLWNLLAYPTTDTERTKTICHWIDVLFSIDDLFVHAPRPRLERLGLHQLDAVLDDDRPAPRAPYPRVLHMLAQRIRAGMPPGLWNRFAHEMKGFFAACRTERDWLEAGTAVDMAAYEASRIKSVGECCFPLLEYGLGIDLTDHFAAMPELRRLNHLVARHWVGVNDIFSYRKELYSGDTINEIALALTTNGGNLQAAVDRITDTIRRTEDEFCALGEHLLATASGRDPAVSRYVEALRWMIAGNLEWSYITTRYNGRDHTWNGHTAATVILAPHRTLFRPE